MLISQKISNDRTFDQVERTVNLHGLYINDNEKTIEFYYSISYAKDGQDISKMFNTTPQRWIISNAYKVIKRDEQLRPIENPTYKQTQQGEPYLTAPAYDYFVSLVFSHQLNLGDIIKSYIALDDEKHAFDLANLTL